MHIVFNKFMTRYDCVMVFTGVCNNSLDDARAIFYEIEEPPALSLTDGHDDETISYVDIRRARHSAASP